MNSRHERKIGPTSSPPIVDPVFHALNFHTLGPPGDVLQDRLQADLLRPDRHVMRLQRIGRIREQLQHSNCDALLLYDPINIRYATDTTNMSIWTMHNQARY